MYFPETFRPSSQPRKKPHALRAVLQFRRSIAEIVIVRVIARLVADVVPEPSKRKPARPHEAPIEIRIGESSAVEDETVTLFAEAGNDSAR